MPAGVPWMPHDAGADVERLLGVAEGDDHGSSEPCVPGGAPRPGASTKKSSSTGSSPARATSM
jgi:hypothetical protein